MIISQVTFFGWANNSLFLIVYHQLLYSRVSKKSSFSQTLFNLNIKQNITLSVYPEFIKENSGTLKNGSFLQYNLF